MNTIELIEHAKQGDEFAFRELLSNFHNMIYSIVNSYELNYGDYRVSRDDLYQEACIALFDAIKTFNPQKDTSINTFAYIVIKRRVARYYKKYMNSYVNEVQSIDAYELQDHQTIMESEYYSPVNIYKAKEFKERVNKGILRLSEEDRKIITMRMEKYSYSEIAEALNITTKRIDNRLSRLRKKYLANN